MIKVQRPIACALGALLGGLLASCAVGPDYKRPATPPSSEFKEAREWKQAEPSPIERGNWWSVYNDPILNELERSIEVSNESVKLSEAQYRQEFECDFFVRADGTDRLYF